MKFLFCLLFFSVVSVGDPAWLTDFTQAKAEASRSNKMILLNFSGSDWCIPCIRLHKELFASEAFRNYASAHLVLVSADFPRLKKNQLSKEQTKQNEALAEQYNPRGTFPLTVLLDARGKVVKQWEGFPKLSPEGFVAEVSGASLVVAKQ